MARNKVEKRRGRPPLKDGAPKRASFSTRLRDETKRRLEKKAEESLRSLSEEIEFRLEQSLRDEGELQELKRFENNTMALFGGEDDNILLGAQFVSLLQSHDIFSPGWRDDEFWTKFVAAVAARFVERLGYFKGEDVKLVEGAGKGGKPGNALARFRAGFSPKMLPSAVDALAKQLEEGEYLPIGEDAWRGIEEKWPVADDDDADYED